MKAAKLLSGLSGASFGAGSDVEVEALECDSRKVTPGACFVAVPGVNVDGHLFVADAIRRGARMIVAEKAVDVPADVLLVRVDDARKAIAQLASRWNDHPSHAVRCVGITGTNGKTTTAFVLRHILDFCDEPTGLTGTVEYAVGDQRRDASATTPDPLEIHALLSQMQQSGMTHAVMEVSSHALDQRRTHGIPFDAAVFTNLTQDHLDYHGDMHSYLDAKLQLFRGLDRRAAAIINRDATCANDVVAVASAARVFTYALDRPADFRADIRQMTLDGTTFELEDPHSRRDVSIGLVGRHNVYNVLAAVATAHALGLDGDRVIAALNAFDGVPGRLERIASVPCGVFVDYAHTDDALANVLGCLADVTDGRLIVVFGCGGDRDRAKRPKMGHVAESCADIAVVTSDNPRSESPRAIVDEILAGMADAGSAHVVLERRQAIDRALALAQPGDCVLIAGKGHEATQVFADHTIQFDDRVTARELVAARSASS